MYKCVYVYLTLRNSVWIYLLYVHIRASMCKTVHFVFPFSLRVYVLLKVHLRLCTTFMIIKQGVERIFNSFHLSGLIAGGASTPGGANPSLGTTTANVPHIKESRKVYHWFQRRALHFIPLAAYIAMKSSELHCARWQWTLREYSSAFW